MKLKSSIKFGKKILKVLSSIFLQNLPFVEAIIAGLIDLKQSDKGIIA